MAFRGSYVASRTLWLMAASAVAVVAVTLLLVRPADSAPEIESTIACEEAGAVHGTPVACTAAGPVDAIIDWGDGSQDLVGEGFAASHAFGSVGPTIVSILDTDGDALAGTSIDITPDLAVTCEQRDIQPVYALAPAIDTSRNPFDYVYLHPETDEPVLPGEAAYPQNLGEVLQMERQVLGHEPAVGLCSAESAVADAFDGTISWTISSDWYDDRVSVTRRITPGTPGDADGVQPIDIQIVVNVEGFEASERIGVFFGGCG